MKLFASIVIAFFLVSALAAQSLRDRAKREGGSATTTMGFEFDVAGVPELLSRSDLVLYGRIIEVKPRLSSDESYVTTDYVIAPLSVVKNIKPMSTARPGESTRIVVNRPGGVLIDDGYRLSTTVVGDSESEALKVGEEAIVFLQIRADSRTYAFTSGPFGAFRVANGHVQAVTKEVAQRRGDKPPSAVNAFLDELQRLQARQ
jgi:hypothetical protein